MNILFCVLKFVYKQCIIIIDFMKTLTNVLKCHLTLCHRLFAGHVDRNKIVFIDLFKQSIHAVILFK